MKFKQTNLYIFFNNLTINKTGPKPKKCFTPPPDYKGSGSSEEETGDEEEESEEEEEESETEEGVVKSSYKVKDEFLEKVFISPTTLNYNI